MFASQIICDIRPQKSGGRSAPRRVKNGDKAACEGQAGNMVELCAKAMSSWEMVGAASKSPNGKTTIARRHLAATPMLELIIEEQSRGRAPNCTKRPITSTCRIHPRIRRLHDNNADQTVDETVILRTGLALEVAEALNQSLPAPE